VIDAAEMAKAPTAKVFTMVNIERAARGLPNEYPKMCAEMVQDRRTAVPRYAG
jgi:hypothetical protein